MRLDDFLSTVGAIKRRTVAKELGTNGLLEVNGQRAKPAYTVKMGDVVRIKGSHPQTIEVLDIPTRSVPKGQRALYFKTLAIC